MSDTTPYTLADRSSLPLPSVPSRKLGIIARLQPFIRIGADDGGGTTMGIDPTYMQPAATAPLAFTFTSEDRRRELAHSRVREHATRR